MKRMFLSRLNSTRETGRMGLTDLVLEPPSFFVLRVVVSFLCV